MEKPQGSVLSRVDWTNVLFFTLTPIISFIFLGIYFYLYPMEWRWLVMLIIGVAITNMSITCGYHRFFAHLSYESHPILKVIYLLFGAGAFQGSVLEWCSDHRRHHRYVDSQDDPYSINKGFWYAHIGWIFMNLESEGRFDNAKDLQRDAWIQWQHDHYFKIAITMGFIVPILVGWVMGNPFAGLVFGGGLRLFFSHHTTFFINSLCHYWGRKPYTDINSARDSILMAVLTFGEGYHNYHHKFQADYRNGIRWYHWDPTKWAIFSLSLVKLTKNLRTIPAWEILKARLNMDEKRLIDKGVPHEKFAGLKQTVEEAQKRWRERYEEYQKAKANMIFQSHEKLVELKREMKLARREMKMFISLWRANLKVWLRTANMSN